MSPFELRRVPKLTADASAEQRAGRPLAGVGALAAAPRAASDGPGADALHAAAPSLTASVLCVPGGFLRKNSRGLSFKAECLVSIWQVVLKVSWLHRLASRHVSCKAGSENVASPLQ